MIFRRAKSVDTKPVPRFTYGKVEAMKRGLVLLLSICICMTQAIGLLHGIAHGQTGYAALTYSGSGHKHSHEVGHEVGRDKQSALGLSKPLAVAQSKPSALGAQAISLAEHDKQTCLLIDALATAAGLLTASCSSLVANTSDVSIATVQTFAPQPRRFDYWPTGPPII